MSTDGWKPPGGSGGGGGGMTSALTDGDTIQGNGLVGSPIALRQVHVGTGLSGTGTASSPLIALGGGGSSGGAGSLCPANPTFVFFPPGNTIIGVDGSSHVVYDNIGGFTYDGVTSGQINAWSDAAGSPPATVGFGPQSGATGHPTYDPASKCLILPNQWTGGGAYVAFNTSRATVAWYGKGLSDIFSGGGIIGWGPNNFALKDAGGGNYGIYSAGFNINGTIPGGLGNFVALLFDIAPPNINVYYSLAPFTGWTWCASYGGWSESPTGSIYMGSDLGGAGYRQGTRYFGTYGYWPRALGGTLGTTPTGEYLNVLNMLISGNPQAPFAASIQGDLASQGAMKAALKNMILGGTQGTYLPGLPDNEAPPWYQGAPEATIAIVHASQRHGQILFPPMKPWDYGSGNWGYTITGSIPLQPTGSLRGMNSWLYAGDFSTGVQPADTAVFGQPMVYAMFAYGAQAPAIQYIAGLNLQGNMGYPGNSRIVGIISNNSCRTVFEYTHVESCYIAYIDNDPQYQVRSYRHAVNCVVGFQMSNDTGGGMVDYTEPTTMHIAWIQANGHGAGGEGVGHIFCGGGGTNGSSGGGFPLNLKGRWSKICTAHMACINPRPIFVGSISGTTLTVTQWISGYPLRQWNYIYGAPGTSGFASVQVSGYGTGRGFTGTYTLTASLTVASQQMTTDKWFSASFRLEEGSSEYSWGGQGGEDEWSPTFYWWAPQDAWFNFGAGGAWNAGTTYAKGNLIDNTGNNYSWYVSLQDGNTGHAPTNTEPSGAVVENNSQWWMNTTASGMWVPFRVRGCMNYLQSGYRVFARNTDQYDGDIMIFCQMEDGALYEFDNIDIGGNKLTYAVRARGPNARVDFKGPVPTKYGGQSPIYENVWQRPEGIFPNWVGGNFGENRAGAGSGPFTMSCFGPAEYRADWAQPLPGGARTISSSPWTNSTNFPAWVTFTGGSGVVISIGGNALPTGLHYGGPIQVPAGAILSWTSTTAPTVTYALPMGTHYSPINSQGSAIGQNRYIVPMTGSSSNVTVTTALDADIASAGGEPLWGGTPPWVTSGGTTAAGVTVGSVTFAAGSDPVNDFAATPYGAGGGSQTTFGDMGYPGQEADAHSYMGMELKLVTAVAADDYTGQCPGFSYVRIAPYIGAFGHAQYQDGGGGNVWGCSPYANQNPISISVPAGPQTSVTINNPYQHDYSLGKDTSNCRLTISGGTNVTVAGPSGGYIRWPDGVNGGYISSGSGPYNQGTGQTVTYLLDNAGANNANPLVLAYTVAPTVTARCAHPQGITLWHGQWMWVPIYWFSNRDGQYCFSLLKTNTVPITILYRKFAYVRCRHQHKDIFNKAFKQGAWW